MRARPRSPEESVVQRASRSGDMPSTSMSSSACCTCSALGLQRCCRPTVLVDSREHHLAHRQRPLQRMARIDVTDRRPQLAHVDLAQHAAEDPHLPGGRMLERAQQA